MNLSIIKKISKDIPLIPLYYLSFLIPRNKNKWIVQSWDTNAFIDNSKYFYLYCSKKPIDITLISKNKYIIKKMNEKGYNAKYIWSISGIWSMLRASEYIIDNAFIGPGLWLRGSARLTQLWHGIGIKKIGYHLHPKNKEKLMKIYKQKIAPWLGYRKKDIFILPTKHYSNMIEKGFCINKKNIISLGYPRNERILKDVKDSELFNEPHLTILNQLKQENKKLILYLPSWGHKNNNVKELLNFKKIIPLLEKTESYLIIKSHKIGEKITGAKSSNIIELPKDFDIYTILKDADILITDYSSVAYDFLFIDKPLIFYPYDIKWYKRNVNPFNYDFYKHSPGPIANNPYEFFILLKETINGKDNYKKERKKELNFWFDYNDSKASERIYKFIKRTQ